MATLTANPVAGAVSPCDGPVNQVASNSTFAVIIAAAGNQGGLTSTATDKYVGVTASATVNQFAEVHRSGFNFDTSSLGSGATISAAVFSLWGTAKANALGTGDLHVCSFSPASTAAIPASAYALMGSTSFGSVAYASFDATNTIYTDITLNASGIAAISLTGITSFGTKLSWDINASFGGVWASGAAANLNGQFADAANKPKLTITYTTGGGVTTSSTFMMMGI